MPNWVYNEVEIMASKHKVEEFLTAVPTTEGEKPRLCFNLHRLYPERFGEDDPS
jgi:hypothetical protein